MTWSTSVVQRPRPVTPSSSRRAQNVKCRRETGVLKRRLADRRLLADHSGSTFEGIRIFVLTRSKSSDLAKGVS